MTGGTLFTALLLSHLVGDWIVQTDNQAATKTTSWPAMVQHVAGYHLVMLAVLAVVWPAGVSQLPALAIVIVSAVSHAMIDRRWPTVWLMRVTRSAALAEQTWGLFVVDQALHLSILAALALLVGTLL